MALVGIMEVRQKRICALQKLVSRDIVPKVSLCGMSPLNEALTDMSP